MNISVRSVCFLFALLVTAARLLASDETNIDLNQLAQRFRPYYKFSTDVGTEPCRPCSWQWFAAHANLYNGTTRVATMAELRTDPLRLLSFPEADIRTAHAKCSLDLRPAKENWSGEDWQSIINDGDGLYAQCEQMDERFVILTYWVLFAYNKTTASLFGHSGNHEGDIIAVSLVYDRATDRLVRASYDIHGQVLESFDLISPKSKSSVKLKGRSFDNRHISTSATMIRVRRDYQDGPWWHSPSKSEIYFAEDPDTTRHEHLVIFCEWGAHEPWPNPSGSVTTAPKHGGDGVSFLPQKVRFIGSITNPVPAEAPFLFFNGRWGNDPKGILFHRSCFYPEGRDHNRFRIPESQFVDRDPFDSHTLPWPPK